MKKILTAVLGTAFLLGCSTLSQKQDSPTSQEQNKQAADASFEQRMKLARKPYAFLAVDYMDVADGKEKLYLEVEAAWQKIHERMASDGKILSGGREDYRWQIDLIPQTVLALEGFLLFL